MPSDTHEELLDRDRVECLVRHLTQLLAAESNYQFMLRFSDNKVTITVHSTPVEIVLRKPKGGGR